jgi:hypothetical protein
VSGIQTLRRIERLHAASNELRGVKQHQQQQHDEEFQAAHALAVPRFAAGAQYQTVTC